MAKNKKQKAFDADSYRKGRYVDVELPSCRMTAEVRPLNPREIVAIVKRHPAATEQVEAVGNAGKDFGDLTAYDAKEALPAFYSLEQALACAASVTPRMVMQPTRKPGEIFVGDLHPFDLEAILAAAIPAEFIEAAENARRQRTALEPIPAEFAVLEDGTRLEDLEGMDDPEIRRKTIENMQVASSVIAFGKSSPTVERKKQA